MFVYHIKGMVCRTIKRPARPLKSLNCRIIRVIRISICPMFFTIRDRQADLARCAIIGSLTASDMSLDATGERRGIVGTEIRQTGKQTGGSMIIKVERWSNDHEWLVVDGIESITKGGTYIDEPVRMDDFLITDAHDNNCNYSHTMFIRFKCTKANKNFDIIFDTCAYIMNDQGKTLDRIVATIR